MIRFRSVLVSVVSLSSAPIGAADQNLIAISCEGTWYKGEPFGENESVRDQSRRYVIDEANKTIGYWNEDKEIVVPLCDSDWKTCSFEFEPTRIGAEGVLNSKGSKLFKLSRRSGFVEEYWFHDEPPHSFYMGYCDKTTVPEARTDLNKF